MRVCGKEPEFIKNDSKTVGLMLPSDFVAEHEYGIKGIASQFGIIKYKVDEGPDGIDRRKATKIPDAFLYEESKGITGLSVGLHIYNNKPNLFNNLPSEIRYFKKDSKRNNEAAWNSFGFCFLTKNKENSLIEIYNQIKECNIIVYQTKGYGFRNNNLVIMIHNAVPDSISKEIKEYDENEKKLFSASLKTKIYEKVSKDRYNSLVPVWNKNKLKTEHDVIFFLIPTDNKKYNYGTFTVENIEDWLNEKGPIIKERD